MPATYISARRRPETEFDRFNGVVQAKGGTLEDAERMWKSGMRLGPGGRPVLTLKADPAFLENAVMAALPAGRAATGAKSATRLGRGLLSRVFGSAAKKSVMEGLSREVSSAAAARSAAASKLDAASKVFRSAQAAPDKYLSEFERAAVSPFRNQDMISRALGRGPLPEYSRDWQMYREFMEGPAAKAAEAEARRLAGAIPPARKAVQDAMAEFGEASSRFRVSVDAVRAQRELEGSVFGFRQNGKAGRFWHNVGHNVVESAKFTLGPGHVGRDGAAYGVYPLASKIIRLPGAAAGKVTGLSMEGSAGRAYDMLTSPAAAALAGDAFLAAGIGTAVYNHFGGEDRRNSEIVRANAAKAEAAVAGGTDPFTEKNVAPAYTTTDVASYMSAFRSLAAERDRMNADGQDGDSFYGKRLESLRANSGMWAAARRRSMQAAWGEKYPTREFSDYEGNSNPAAKKIYDSFVREYDSVPDDVHFANGGM